MPKSNTLQLSLTFLCLFFGSFILTHCQLNTHQTIKDYIPKIITIHLQKHDQVKIRVYNTTAPVTIGYSAESKPFKIGTNEYCFAGEQVTLEFISQWKVKGKILLDIEAYEFSYQITINDTVFKKQYNAVRDFLNQKFVYSKTLKPKHYSLLVSYQSKVIPQIQLHFIDKIYTVHANKPNNITITLTQSFPAYSIYFIYAIEENITLEQGAIEVTIQLPNEMLKGCDGTNVYDPRIRACPSKSTQEKDFLQIHKIGSYPSFEVLEKTKTFIKITIVQMQKWKELLQSVRLQMFIANSSDPSIFHNTTITELKSRYSMKNECYFKNSVCNFVFKLQPGNYTVMPALLDAQESFVYLFERSDGDKVIQSYYSVLPTINDGDQIFYQVSGIVEFVSHKEKLTEITLESQDNMFLLQYMIMGRQKKRNAQGEYGIQLVEMTLDGVLNHNPHKATIYSQLQPDSMYLLMFVFVSEDKFKIEQKKREARIFDLDNQLSEEDTEKAMEELLEIPDQDLWGFQDEGDDGDWEITDDDDDVELETKNEDDFDISSSLQGIQTYKTCLKTDTLQLSILNGKFPHKKIIEPKIQNAIVNKGSNTTLESVMNSVGENVQNYAIVIGIVGGVAILLILVFIGKRLKNRMNQNDKQAKELVQEQSCTVNVESATGSTNTNIEISQVVNTQN